MDSGVLILSDHGQAPIADSPLTNEESGEAIQENRAPVIQFADQYVNVGTNVLISSASASDPDGDELIYEWSILNTPAKTAITGLTPEPSGGLRFTPDQIGEFTVNLKVDDRRGGVASKSVTINATVPIVSLPTVIDAEYSQSLDRMVMVSSHPSQLHIYDLSSNQSIDLALFKIPTSVSVSPDGLRAAIGHERPCENTRLPPTFWISY